MVNCEPAVLYDDTSCMVGKGVVPLQRRRYRGCWGCKSTPGVWGFRKGAKPDRSLAITTNTPGFKKLSTALSLKIAFY